MTRWTWRPQILAALAVTLALAGCGVEAGEHATTSGGDRSTTTDAPKLDIDGINDAVGHSLALISTPGATGSAVLLDDGYLVTNAHVVDPFAEVEVSFEGEEPITDVAVVGVDLISDMAVLGPVEVDAPGLDLVDPGEVVEGAPAFLVGFPGDQDATAPEVHVTTGALGEPRSDDHWGIEYLTSTTPIADGQSGGALVDAAGQVIGISAMSDDDTALSLRADDVNASIARVIDGHGSTWHPVDPATASDVVFASFEQEGDVGAWYVEPTLDEQHVTITIDGPAQVAVGEPGDSDVPWAISDSIDPDDDADYWTIDEAAALDEDEPGTWTFDLAPGEPAVVTVGTNGDVAGLDIRSSVPLLDVSTHDLDLEADIGTPLKFTMDSTDDRAYVALELEKGVTYEIGARSPAGDMGWTVQGDRDPDEAVDADDGGGGLFDLDAVETFTPEHTGTYHLFVWEYDIYPTEVEVLVAER